MLLPDTLSPEAFLAEFWQKQPLYLRGAIRATLPALDRDELAWLATQPDVESRIVFTEHSKTNTSFRLEHGPFDEAYLRKLPTEDWTLLVQDVEKHLPDFRSWFDEVPFVPRWRFDDLMVSFAAPGGSVGPHKDNYDVFLCQGEGSRNWAVSSDSGIQLDCEETDLSLLQPFDASASYHCTAGDVLYLPPGIPHWGIASTNCTTWSIGMRAPTRAELAATAQRLFPADGKIAAPDESGSDVFYTDADISLQEVDGRRIATRSLARLREQNLIDESFDEQSAARIMGATVTDPKAWLDPETPTQDEIRAVFSKMPPLPVHGMANLAWYSHGNVELACVNGESHVINARCGELFAAICAVGEAQTQHIQALLADKEGARFLEWMLEKAAFDLLPGAE